jgi:hypothetical protein
MKIQDYDNVYSLWMSCVGIGLNNLDDSKDGIEKFLNRNVYHTIDPAFAIETILEEKNFLLDEESQNKKIMNIIRNQHYEQYVKLIPMTTELAHKLFVDFKNDISLFDNKEDFKGYQYEKKKVDLYAYSYKEKGYILLAIIYKDEFNGENRFKNIT